VYPPHRLRWWETVAHPRPWRHRPRRGHARAPGDAQASPSRPGLSRTSRCRLDGSVHRARRRPRTRAWRRRRIDPPLRVGHRESRGPTRPAPTRRAPSSRTAGCSTSSTARTGGADEWRRRPPPWVPGLHDKPTGRRRRGGWVRGSASRPVWRRSPGLGTPPVTRTSSSWAGQPSCGRSCSPWTSYGPATDQLRIHLSPVVVGRRHATFTPGPGSRLPCISAT
jgi:hypothetical protein